MKVHWEALKILLKRKPCVSNVTAAGLSVWDTKNAGYLIQII